MAILDDLTFLPTISLLFLAANSVSAIYRARRDPSTVGFVAAADLNLLLLLWSLKALEKALRSRSSAALSKKKEELKVLVWVLSTSLNLMFAYRVSRNMTLPMSVTIGTVAVFTSLAIFYGLFVYKESSTHGYGDGGDDDDSVDGSGGQRRPSSEEMLAKKAATQALR